MTLMCHLKALRNLSCQFTLLGNGRVERATFRAGLEGQSDHSETMRASEVRTLKSVRALA